MLVTVITVYRDDSSEHYLGVVKGKLTEGDRDRLAEGFGCKRTTADSPEEEDQIFFRELEVAETATELKAVLNIDGETYAPA